MSENSRVTVAVFAKNQEASIAQATLAADGIESELQGGVTADMLAYLGTAIQGVQLMVAEADAERAAELLSEVSDEREAAPAAPWVCSVCGERVEGNFDLCWSCNAERPDGVPSVSEIEPHTPTESTLADEDADTYDLDEDDPLDRPRMPPEAVVSRAWKSAILGTVFPPLLVYSFVLIAQVSGSELSPQSTRRFYGSLIIVFGMFFIHWMLYRYLSAL